MKKYICLILCFCFLLIVGCKENTDNANDYKSKTGGLSNKIEFKIYDDKSKIWLDNSHIDKIILKSNDAESGIIIKTTQDGKKLLREATEKNMGKILSISVGEKKLYSALVSAPIEDGEVLLNYSYFDYTYLYNYLTGAKDLMAGVTPPKTIISEDQAQKIIFDYKKIPSDKVSDIITTLKITEKSFSWQYYIDFSFDGIKHSAEVNAHSGEIIKFASDFT